MKGRQCRPPAHEAAGPLVLSVRIQPRASRNEIIMMEGGSLKIRLTAPPVEGAANEALIRHLAEALSISRSQVEIVAGHTSRDKRIRISGVSEEELRALLLRRRE